MVNVIFLFFIGIEVINRVRELGGNRVLGLFDFFVERLRFFGLGRVWVRS